MHSSRTQLNSTPTTRPGRWSVRLGFAFALLFAVNIPFNIYVIQPLHASNQVSYITFILIMLACGILAGILGLIATIRHHERSWSVWASTAIGLFALLIFLNESIQGLQYLLQR